jgi:hypothetical protein
MGACGVAGITARITRLGVARVVAAAGRWRGTVERYALSWLNCYRRPGGAVGQGSVRLFAFMLPACAFVCFNQP